MKYFTAIIITLLFSTNTFAHENKKYVIDLKFKSISYENESIPTLSVDLSSEELRQFDFIVAFASNSFKANQHLINEDKREHVYLGFNYKF